jgi:hypothetical protein
MTIRGLDPSGELGRLLFHVQSKNIPAQEAHLSQVPPPSSHADPVDLSLLAQEIHDYSSRASGLPELRVDKIERVQQALETKGELATADQLAEAILKETLLNVLGSK